MLESRGSTGRSGWKPLTKPQWYNANKITQSRLEKLKELYRTNSYSAEQLSTTVVPFKSFIGRKKRICKLSFIEI